MFSKEAVKRCLHVTPVTARVTLYIYHILISATSLVLPILVVFEITFVIIDNRLFIQFTTDLTYSKLPKHIDVEQAKQKSIVVFRGGCCRRIPISRMCAFERRQEKRLKQKYYLNFNMIYYEHLCAI